MKNHTITKKLQASIDKALARSARWETCGRAFLSAGQWRKAIDAFERRLDWVRCADGIRRRGSYWVDPFDPAHEEWRTPSPRIVSPPNELTLTDVELLTTAARSVEGSQLELFETTIGKTNIQPPTVLDERQPPPNPRSALATRRFTDADISSFVQSSTGSILHREIEYVRLQGQEGKCDHIRYSPRSHTVFVFRTFGRNSLDGQPLASRVSLDIVIKPWLPGRSQLDKAPDAEAFFLLLTRHYALGSSSGETMPSDKCPKLPDYIRQHVGYLRAAERILREAPEGSRGALIRCLQVDSAGLSAEVQVPTIS